MSLPQLVQKNISLAGNQTEVVKAIKEILYPDATDAEAQMVWSYCKARGLDPMLRPVHLVPMQVKTNRTDKDGKAVYESRKQVMPGIATYRIEAARTGEYAGMSEPEFGAAITETIEESDYKNKGKKCTFTYPEWCKITVKKIVQGMVVEFTAKEYWKENYATSSRWSKIPNEMWQKRAYGQLAKCTEAQVLRKAFPEAVPHQYTKEEMDGKIHDANHIEVKSFPSPRKESVQQAINQVEVIVPEEDPNEIDLLFMDYKAQIEEAQNLKDLEKTFKIVWKMDWKDTDYLVKLTNAKDARKTELSVQEFQQEYDAATGEVKA